MNRVKTFTITITIKKNDKNITRKIEIDYGLVNDILGIEHQYNGFSPKCVRQVIKGIEPIVYTYMNINGCVNKAELQIIDEFTHKEYKEQFLIEGYYGISDLQGDQLGRHFITRKSLSTIMNEREIFLFVIQADNMPIQFRLLNSKTAQALLQIPASTSIIRYGTFDIQIFELGKIMAQIYKSRTGSSSVMLSMFNCYTCASITRKL